MTEPRKPRPRRRRPKPENPLPVEHPQRANRDNTSFVLVTPAELGLTAAPCVDYNATGTFDSASTAHVTYRAPAAWRVYLADSFTRTARRLLRWADSLTRTP